MGLPTEYQQYIHLSRYARWLDDLGRRETWEETVDRFIGFFKKHISEKFDDVISDNDFTKIKKNLILRKKLSTFCVKI